MAGLLPENAAVGVISFGLFRRESPTSDNMIGFLSIHRVDVVEDIGDLGYMLHPDYWGQGLATEALRAFMAVFRGTKWIRAEVDAENVASLRVLERLGFLEYARRPAGTLPNKIGERELVELRLELKSGRQSDEVEAK